MGRRNAAGCAMSLSLLLAKLPSSLRKLCRVFYLMLGAMRWAVWLVRDTMFVFFDEECFFLCWNSLRMFKKAEKPHYES